MSSWTIFASALRRKTTSPNHAPVYKHQYFRFLRRLGLHLAAVWMPMPSGMGDFGRVNAHRPRWSSFPGLRESNTHKRACLFCWARSRKLIEDSEWHSVFSCPVGSACRQRFQLALSDCRNKSGSTEQPKEIFEFPSKSSRLPNSSDLARLTILCRSESEMASELARFIVDLTASRKRAFAKLTVRDLFPESS